MVKSSRLLRREQLARDAGNFCGFLLGLRLRNRLGRSLRQKVGCE
jgi:hypothetical protein